MAQTQKLSLFAAIIISINIMLGTGIFINTTVLTKQAGSLGAAVYLLVGILILPLILAIASLLHYHNESGTFYDFGRSVSPFFGFLSSWSYFTAKCCSAALGIHVCLSFLQRIIPPLQQIPLLIFDDIIIILFMLLNLLNLKTGRTIQYSFICLKIIPILFVIFSGLSLISGAHFSSDTLIFSGVPLSVPLVLYAFTGFETSCSLSASIHNPKRNGPLAIFISYAVVVTILFLYQFLFYGSLGTALGTLKGGFLDIFPTLLEKFMLSPTSKLTLQKFLHIAIASSSLGAAYGIIYSNSWNLYTLAQNNHTFSKKLFTTLNTHSMPVACIFTEGILMVVYLLITQGNQIPLQQVAALGVMIAYTLSSVALLILTYKNERTIKLTPVLSIISCLLFLSSFMWAISISGPTLMLLLFICLLIFGSFMFYKKLKVQPPLDVFEEL